MTPKEKSKQLVEKYLKKIIELAYAETKTKELAKESALICVDEIQEHAQMIETEYEGYNNPYQYFLQVKLEISLL
jgi:hypothetical protein